MQQQTCAGPSYLPNLQQIETLQQEHKYMNICLRETDRKLYEKRKEKREKRECSEKSNTSDEQQQLQILIIQTSIFLFHTHTHVGMRTADENAEKNIALTMTTVLIKVCAVVSGNIFCKM